MNTPSLTSLEDRLRRAAHAFAYPRTPDVSRAVRLRLVRPPAGGARLALRIAALVLVVLAAALAVPQVRAKLIEWFQVGVIRVLPGYGTPTPAASAQAPRTATPRGFDPSGQPEHVVSIAGLAGETTLEQARARVFFDIRLPADLGPPDRVFLQNDGPTVILVWLEAAEPGRVRLSLHLIGPNGFYMEKYHPQVILETEVHGEYALWAEGPYLVDTTTGHEAFRRLVEGNTLIWKEGTITYRLESQLSVDEAIRIAESLE
jgi:hypothetical protein